LESSAYYDAIWENRDFDLVIYRTYEDSWSPHGFIRQMFSVRNDEKAVCWTDPVLSKMIVTVLASQDETSRQEGWDSIFTRIHENAYTVPICVPNKTYTYNKRLKNVKAASTSYESALWHLIDLE
jgi:peptide/nickel transport system substrate-binding protein